MVHCHDLDWLLRPGIVRRKELRASLTAMATRPELKGCSKSGDGVLAPIFEKRYSRDLAPAERRRLRREYILLQHLRADGLARSLSLVRSHNADWLLCTTRIAGEPIAAHVGRTSGLALLQALGDVLRVLDLLHSAGLVHADVSPRNVLVEERAGASRGWLVDFEFVARSGQSWPGGRVRGTPATMAPEVRAGANPTACSDLYSLGRLLLAVARGALPAVDWTGASAHPGGLEVDFTNEIRGSLDSARLASLLQACLAPDPAQRPTAHAARVALYEALGEARPAPFECFGARTAWGVQPLAEREIIGCLKAVAKGRGAALALVGRPGSGRSTLLHSAATWASAYQLPVLSALPLEQSEPALVLLKHPGAEARAAAMSRAARFPERPILTMAALPTLPIDPRVRCVEMRELEPRSAGLLAAAILGVPEVPRELVAFLLGSRIVHPAAIRNALAELIAMGTLRRSTDGEALLVRVPQLRGRSLSWPQNLPEKSVIAVAKQALIGPLLGAEAGRDRGTSTAPPNAPPPGLEQSLTRAAPPALRRWLDAQVGQQKSRELFEQAGRVLLAAGGAAANRGTAVLAAAGQLSAQAEAILLLAENAIAEGEPRRGAGLAWVLLRELEGGHRLRSRAAIGAALGFSRAGRARLAAKLLERELRGIGVRHEDRRALLCGLLEARLQQGDLNAAGVTAQALREALSAVAPRPHEALALGRAAQLAGDEEGARRWAELALAQVRQGSPALRARALNLLGLLDYRRGEIRKARRRLVRAQELRAEIGALGEEAATCMNLALLDQDRGHFGPAKANLLRALELRRESSDLSGTADVLEHLGRWEAQHGEDQSALLRFRETLALRRRARNRRGVAAVRHNVGIIEARLGDTRAALDASLAAAKMFAELGDSPAALAARANAALSWEQEGETERALIELRAVLRGRRRLGIDRTGTARHLAAMLLRRGQTRRAARIAMIAAGGARAEGRNELLLLAARALLQCPDPSGAAKAIAALVRSSCSAQHELERVLIEADLQRIEPARGAEEPVFDPQEIVDLAQRAGPALQPETGSAAAKLLARAARPELARTVLGLPPMLQAARQPRGGVLIDLAWTAIGADAHPIDRPLARTLSLADQLDLFAARVETRIAEAVVLRRHDLPDEAEERLRQAAAILGEGSSFPLLRRSLAVVRGDRSAPAESQGQQVVGLLRVGQLLASIQDPEQVFQAIMQVVLETVGAERAVLTLRGPSDDEFEVAIARNAAPSVVRDVCLISRSILSRSYQEGRILHSSNALQDREFNGLRSVQLYRIVAFACVPLAVAGRIIGTVYVDHSSTAKAFTAREREFLRAFSGIAATALEHARMHRSLRQKAADLSRGVEALHGLSSVVYKSRPMTRVIKQARRIAVVDAPLLLLGETGVGKGVLARAIHYSGPRAAGPFVEIDCGALPATLADSELFGHERGSFTGAHRAHQGAFERADGGTLLLDEIGNLSMEAQNKLLRVLQDHRVRRVGGERARSIDVRVISATNADLRESIGRGRFREELLFRINTLTLEIPPLRNRRADVLALADHYLRGLALELKRTLPQLEPGFREGLKNAPWPGNVRQLHNILHRLAVLETSQRWGESLLPAELFGGFPPSPTPVQKLVDLERQALVEALEAERWNRSGAARRLGLTLRQVRHRISRFGLSTPPRGRASRSPRRDSP